MISLFKGLSQGEIKAIIKKKGRESISMRAHIFLLFFRFALDSVLALIHGLLKIF